MVYSDVKRGQNLKAKAEAKILASRPLWPRKGQSENQPNKCVLLNIIFHSVSIYNFNKRPNLFLAMAVVVGRRLKWACPKA